MESKTIMKRNLQFCKPPNCKYECIAFILLNEEYIYNAYMNKLYTIGLYNILRGYVPSQGGSLYEVF